MTVAEKLAELSKGNRIDIALESGETLSVYVAGIEGEADGLTATATQTITCKTLEGRTFRAATEFHAHTDETTVHDSPTHRSREQRVRRDRGRRIQQPTDARARRRTARRS